jgi:hypothetical protein
MPPEITTLFAALGGTALGGFINYFATRSAKSMEWKLGLIKERIAERSNLFSAFIVSAQKMVMLSIEDKPQKPSELDLINNEFAKIELLCSSAVVEAAKQICDYVIVAHSQKKDEDERSFFSLKQTFIAESRRELAELENDA